MSINEEIEEIKNIIEDSRLVQRIALKQFLSLLFWKDCSSGLVSIKTREEIITLMENSYRKGPEGGQWVKWNKEKGLEIANTIRKQIGLPELEIDGGTVNVKAGDKK